MAYLHWRIWIPIQTANQMATLYEIELFTLHRVRFPSQLPSTGMGLESRLESESAFVNVNKL